jgi:glyoxylase-like metal-dependent hydrolase (beta-lactamase superfamily II)
MNALRLYVFDAGRIHTRGVRFTNPAGAEETRDMADPNHCYLVRHPRGLLAWDAGLPDTIAALPGCALERGKFRFELRRALAAQMAEAGFDPREVDFVAFSHLQIDHAGNAGLFERATTLLQAAEAEMAFGPEAEHWGYRLGDYAALAGREMVRLEGDYDVFGDGKVVLLAAPGHTPGHQVLLVRLAGGPVLLSGDLYYAGGDPAGRWMPGWNYDHGQTLRTMERLERIAAESGARWLINHEPRQRDSLPLAPRWME